ncbi:MAG: hypothetical protein U9N14_07605, partial [Pseudomonadota bacterium]|nr:hypothetical protein [Pseudomonadota bacterium]
MRKTSRDVLAVKTGSNQQQNRNRQKNESPTAPPERPAQIARILADALIRCGSLKSREQVAGNGESSLDCSSVS